MNECSFCKQSMRFKGAGCQTEDGARNCDHYAFSESHPFRGVSNQRTQEKVAKVRAQLAPELGLPFTHGRNKELIREYAVTDTLQGHIAGEILSMHAPYIAEKLINALLENMEHGTSP